MSYSHTDATFVNSLVRWLRDDAGLHVWWDASRLVAGDPLGAALPVGVASARTALFCVSRGWNESTWCENEFNAALQERRTDRRYRVIAARLDDCEVPTFLANARYLELRTLEPESAAALLEAFVPEPASWFTGRRDVYFSYSWHGAKGDPAAFVAAGLIQHHGFRLIGDSPDYAKFEGDRRVKHIIETCGGFVAVFPFRDEPDHGFTSPWILKEVAAAQSLGRPCLLFGAEGVKLHESVTAAAIGRKAFPLPRSRDDEVMSEALKRFDDHFRAPEKPAFAFFATSLRDEAGDPERIASMIEQVTSMECLLGQRLRGQHAQAEIVDRIREAQFVVADVSAASLNTLIEAGVARGAGTPLHLISSVPASGELKTRFMFRDLEVNWYRNPVERVGVVHRIARLYRRRVFSPPSNLV